MQGPPSAEKGKEKGWKGSRMISKRSLSILNDKEGKIIVHFRGAGETRREVVEISRDHRLLRWFRFLYKSQNMLLAITDTTTRGICFCWIFV